MFTIDYSFEFVRTTIDVECLFKIWKSKLFNTFFLQKGYLWSFFNDEMWKPPKEDDIVWFHLSKNLKIGCTFVFYKLVCYQFGVTSNKEFSGKWNHVVWLELIVFCRNGAGRFLITKWKYLCRWIINLKISIPYFRRVTRVM